MSGRKNVEYRVGDLLDQTDVGAIGHGVNLHGNMGSGIAVLFKKKFPKMHESYVQVCEESVLQFGSVMSYRENGTTVLNIATQVDPGANASLAGVEVGLVNAVRVCEGEGISSFAIPQIGAGIGGLNWNDVDAVIHKVAETTTVKIVVVEFG